MKQVRRHHQFEKNFKKRVTPNAKLTAKFEQRLTLFMSGERGYPLNDHALTGALKGKRAFSITADVRSVYEETADEIIFLDVGTHVQVYGG